MNDGIIIKLNELKKDGITVLNNVFSLKKIQLARHQVIKNRYLFRNTRPTPSSSHLAGFHRFPQLESLHIMLSSNNLINDFFKLLLNGQLTRTIGLSDITINRSQGWHTDLLRGKYAHFIYDTLNWVEDVSGVYKLLLYLQDGSSLNYIQGSHLIPISLDNDSFSGPNGGTKVEAKRVFAGDVVIMDIRCSHRGVDESFYASGNWDKNPRILISSVLGRINNPLTVAMELGNLHRLQDWDRNFPFIEDRNLI